MYEEKWSFDCEPKLLFDSAFRPQYGGKFCPGSSRVYQLCNTNPCQENSLDFRAQQCAEYNSKPFRGWFYQWKPYTKVEGKSFPANVSVQCSCWAHGTEETIACNRAHCFPCILRPTSVLNQVPKVPLIFLPLFLLFFLQDAACFPQLPVKGLTCSKYTEVSKLTFAFSVIHSPRDVSGNRYELSRLKTCNTIYTS